MKYQCECERGSHGYFGRCAIALALALALSCCTISLILAKTLLTCSGWMAAMATNMHTDVPKALPPSLPHQPFPAGPPLVVSHSSISLLLGFAS